MSRGFQTAKHAKNAFLDGKPNHLKDHPRFLNYNYDFIDKSYPSLDDAKALIEGTQ